MAEPQVPSLAPVQQAPSGQSDDINAVLGKLTDQVLKPLPPQYTQGTTIAQPRINPVPTFTPQNANRAPLNNQATSLKQARQQNAFASLSNLVGQAGHQLAQRKSDLLKEDLKTVMKAKENIANAKMVLQQDPNNKMAQNVLAANKKQLEAILNDPKKQKPIAKALDISFTDMDKNKTPEIKAYQAAVKEFKESGIFNADNPTEAKIAAQAAGGGGGQQQQSQTPRADAAVAKDLPNIQANPQYAEALKERDEAQKQLNQYVIPRLITAETQKQIANMKENKADARAEFKATVDFQRDASKQLAAMNIENAKIKASMAETIRRDSDAMARTQLEVNARLKIAADKRLDPANKMKLKTEALDKVDASIKNITAERMSLSTQMQNAKSDDEKKILQHALDYNTLKMEATNTYRQQVATDVYGKVAEGRSGRLDDSGITTQSVGSNLSDESDDNSDEDSDDY